MLAVSALLVLKSCHKQVEPKFCLGHAVAVIDQGNGRFVYQVFDFQMEVLINKETRREKSWIKMMAYLFHSSHLSSVIFVYPLFWILPFCLCELFWQHPASQQWFADSFDRFLGYAVLTL